MASLGLSFPSAMCCPQERPPCGGRWAPRLNLLNWPHWEGTAAWETWYFLLQGGPPQNFGAQVGARMLQELGSPVLLCAASRHSSWSWEPPALPLYPQARRGPGLPVLLIPARVVPGPGEGAKWRECPAVSIQPGGTCDTHTCFLLSSSIHWASVHRLESPPFPSPPPPPTSHLLWLLSAGMGQEQDCRMVASLASLGFLSLLLWPTPFLGL